MFLTKSARSYCDYLIKEYKIPKSEHATLEIGVFYYFEWQKIAEQLKEEKIDVTAHDKGNDAIRLNPIMRYFDRCWVNWESVSNRYGFDPLGKKRIGVIEKKDPKESTKKKGTKTNLRGGPNLKIAQ